jgi:hypothetical protein
MNVKKLSADYIIGFVDGEGCFALSIRRDVRHERKSKAAYYSWKASFAINLRADDAKILELMKCSLGVGSVTYSKSNTTVRYQVSNLSELQNNIVPFFSKNQLVGKKKLDFELWKEAVKILFKYKTLRGELNLTKGLPGFQKTKWEEKDTLRLVEIQKQSAIYKSKGTNKWTDLFQGRIY